MRAFLLLMLSAAAIFGQGAMLQPESCCGKPAQAIISLFDNRGRVARYLKRPAGEAAECGEQWEDPPGPPDPSGKRVGTCPDRYSPPARSSAGRKGS